jgi:Fe-S cluster assembly protein SufD
MTWEELTDEQRAVLTDYVRNLRAWAGEQARTNNHSDALNTAYIADGAFVYMPRGTVLAAPVQLLFLARAGETPLVMYPRNLVVVEENAQLTMTEHYVGLGGE